MISYRNIKPLKGADHPLDGEGVVLVPSRTGEKTPICIWDLLQWTFRREMASVNFDDYRVEYQPSVGMEYVIMKRAELFDADDFPGRIDGGGTSPCHPDADVVAGALAVLPSAQGGRQMALSIAEHARAGTFPDYKAQPRPRCVPEDWRHSKHGLMARRVKVGEERWISRGRLRRADVYACPVRYFDTGPDVSRVRRQYLAFWGALLFLRGTLACDQLSAWQVTKEMPPLQPWKKSY